jgi:hypothetical protein
MRPYMKVHRINVQCVTLFKISITESTQHYEYITKRGNVKWKILLASKPKAYRMCRLASNNSYLWSWIKVSCQFQDSSVFSPVTESMVSSIWEQCGQHTRSKPIMEVMSQCPYREVRYPIISSCFLYWTNHNITTISAAQAIESCLYIGLILTV